MWATDLSDRSDDTIWSAADGTSPRARRNAGDDFDRACRIGSGEPAHLDVLFNHADADFAGLLPGLRALLNRIVRNAL